MDSRYAVRDLPTAARLGAFDLMRWRLATAVEVIVTTHSRMHDFRASGAPGLPLFTVIVCRQKSIEFFASRVKRALLLFREAAMDQWPFIVGDGLTDQLSNRALSEFGRVVNVSDDFTTEQPQVVTVQVAGLA